MITSELIQRVQSLYSKGVQSDDSRLTPRHIYNKLITTKNKLIVQKSKKRQRLNQWNYQTLDCIELIKAKKHECPCVPPDGCEIYRSKFKIPKILIGMDNHLISSVSTVNGFTTYNEIGWTELKYKSSSRYTSTKPDYYIRNEYIYVIQRKGASVISITAIFEDPYDVYLFESACPCEDCKKCTSPLDIEIPIDDDLIDTVIEMAVQELIMVYSQNNEDTNNNTSVDNAQN